MANFTVEWVRRYEDGEAEFRPVDRTYERVQKDNNIAQVIVVAVLALAVVLCFLIFLLIMKSHSTPAVQPVSQEIQQEPISRPRVVERPAYSAHFVYDCPNADGTVTHFEIP